MQLLIVHRDAEIAEQLVQMVKDYSAHDVDLAGSEPAALDWGRRHTRCGLLITQLQGEGLDGLALGGAFSEIFPGLQTLFLPPYPASEQRLTISTTKIFPGADRRRRFTRSDRAGRDRDRGRAGCFPCGRDIADVLSERA
jgi:hypothetical protein